MDYHSYLRLYRQRRIVKQWALSETSRGNMTDEALKRGLRDVQMLDHRPEIAASAAKIMNCTCSSALASTATRSLFWKFPVRWLISLLLLPQESSPLRHSTS